jgi:hypothetical protein
LQRNDLFGTSNVYFFNGAGPETDVEDSFQRWVNYKEAQKQKRNYNMALGINRQHPKKDCIQSGKLPPAARSGAVAPP